MFHFMFLKGENKPRFNSSQRFVIYRYLPKSETNARTSQGFFYQYYNNSIDVTLLWTVDSRCSKGQ